VRGVLFDVDGTLLENDRPIPGAPAALDRLRARGIPFRLTTNTSRRPRSAIASVLRRGGFSVEDREVLAPCVLARRHILESSRTRAGFLLPGAALLALHKNRVWDNGVDGIVLDAGPFVAALEYAAEVTAELVGKPARPFFDLALADIGLPAAEVMVVGDDLEADCGGGAAAGCRTALVLSGRTRREDVEISLLRTDLVRESVASLLE